MPRSKWSCNHLIVCCTSIYFNHLATIVWGNLGLLDFHSLDGLPYAHHFAPGTEVFDKTPAWCVICMVALCVESSCFVYLLLNLVSTSYDASLSMSYLQARLVVTSLGAHFADLCFFNKTMPKISLISIWRFAQLALLCICKDASLAVPFSVVFWYIYWNVVSFIRSDGTLLHHQSVVFAFRSKQFRRPIVCLWLLVVIYWIIIILFASFFFRFLWMSQRERGLVV